MTDPAHAGAPAVDLTFDAFSATNRERCESPTGFNHALASWSTSDWFLAVLGELGEAANIAKKLNRVRDGIPGNKESAEVLRDKLRRELGDVFVYLDLLAQSLGVSIGGAAVEVFNAKSDELGCPIRLHVSSRSPEAEQAVCQRCKSPVTWHKIKCLYDCTECGHCNSSAVLLASRASAPTAEQNILRKALVGLVGADGREELEQMEAALRLAPAPAEDKAAAIDGVHALLATLSSPLQAAR